MPPRFTKKRLIFLIALVLVAAGAWLALRARNTFNPLYAAPQIQDLFIGQGSDGRWYYSTFHFCVQKVTLFNEGTQPDSLLQFADGYSLRPFDTHSNDCLQSTWTPGLPYGVDYFQNAPKP